MENPQLLRGIDLPAGGWRIVYQSNNLLSLTSHYAKELFRRNAFS